MKKPITLSLILITTLSFAQPLNRYFERANGTIHLLGHVTLERLQQEPFGEWYQENHSEYEVSVKDLEGVSLPDSITIFMGTWCGDSRREVPRFIKMLEKHDYDLSQLRIICLNTGFQNYKQAPEREERGQSIHRVPTFIFQEKDGTEIGRIVEEPVVTLEADTKAILSGEVYSTYYPVVADLLKKFDQYSLKELRKMSSKLADQYKSQAVSEYELNTYGYVLWSSWDLMKAEFVFELNTKMFPDKVSVYRSLASIKETLGQKKEVIAIAKKGLALDPEDERLKSISSGGK
ncbi:MAG: thioredoxin family protein [Cyclobacteriaceae bacterium]